MLSHFFLARKHNSTRHCWILRPPGSTNDSPVSTVLKNSNGTWKYMIFWYNKIFLRYGWASLRRKGLIFLNKLKHNVLYVVGKSFKNLSFIICEGWRLFLSLHLYQSKSYSVSVQNIFPVLSGLCLAEKVRCYIIEYDIDWGMLHCFIKNAIDNKSIPATWLF